MHSSGQTRGTTPLCGAWVVAAQTQSCPRGRARNTLSLECKAAPPHGLDFGHSMFCFSGTAVCSNWESFLVQSLNVSILRVPNLGGFLWAHSSHTHTHTQRQSL